MGRGKTTSMCYSDRIAENWAPELEIVTPIHKGKFETKYETKKLSLGADIFSLGYTLGLMLKIANDHKTKAYREGKVINIPNNARKRALNTAQRQNRSLRCSRFFILRIRTFPSISEMVWKRSWARLRNFS